MSETYKSYLEAITSLQGFDRQCIDPRPSVFTGIVDGIQNHVQAINEQLTAANQIIAEQKEQIEKLTLQLELSRQHNPVTPFTRFDPNTGAYNP